MNTGAPTVNRGEIVSMYAGLNTLQHMLVVVFVFVAVRLESMSIASALCYDVMSSSLLSQMYTKYIVSILTHLQIQELKRTLHWTHPQLANRTLRVRSLVCHEVQGGYSQFYILETKSIHNNIHM